MSNNYNSGYRNSGNCNSGNCNSGDYNSGYCNSGDYNSGYCNSGYRNSGYRNSGYRNSGDYNSGNCNSGDYNSGDYNSGYCNSGDYNSGMFNTDEPPARFFNKISNKKLSEINMPNLSYFTLNEWICSDNMSNKEKSDNPSYTTTGGYLKTLTYFEAWEKLWNTIDDEEKQKYLNLPNFDADIFNEITGIDVTTPAKNVELANKAKQLREEADKLLAKAKELDEMTK